MIKYDDIKKANETIQTMKITRKDKETGEIKSKDYAEVNQRIKAFRMCNPNGTITTDIVSNENGVVLMKATIQDEEGKTIGTGYASEKETSSYINRTSYIENCETSAVGRALGMCGFGIDTSVASYEEVTNAINNQQPTNQQDKTVYRQKLIDYCNANGLDMNKIAVENKLNGNSTAEQFIAVLKKLGVN